MKILMVNKFLHPCGGAETYTFKLGDYLQSVGHEVQYFGMDSPERIVGNNAGVYTTNMDFHNASVLSNITYPFKIIYSVEARKKMRIVLEDFQPDVVHLNNINFQLTPSIIYEIKKNKIPIIQTVHDVQICCPVHRCYIEHSHRICDKCDNGSYIECVKNKCLQKSFIKSLIATIESYYYHKRDTYNLVDLYICPSEFISRKINLGGVNWDKIKVLYNFSDFIDSELNGNRNRNDKYCLYFGRLSKEKGINTLLEVAGECKDIKLIIAGRGPLEKVVQEKANNITNLVFVGMKSGADLYQLISNAEFSICSSEWYENCPLSVIESQALGTPVIGSDFGGTVELIEEGKTGLVYEGGNKQELIKCMYKLWNDEELVQNMRSNCLQKKQNRIDVYTQKMIAEYTYLIK